MASSGCVLERKATQPGDVWLHRSAPPLVNSARRCWCKFKREANFYALDGKKMQAILKGFSLFPWQLVCLHSGDERPDICVYISILQGPPKPTVRTHLYPSTSAPELQQPRLSTSPLRRLWSPCAEGSLMSCDWRRRTGGFILSQLLSPPPTIKELDPDLRVSKQLSIKPIVSSEQKLDPGVNKATGLKRICWLINSRVHSDR